MKYQLNDKRIINVPDKDIERLMNTLKLNQVEAVQLWLEDEGYLENETVEELSEKARKNRITATIHQAKAVDGAKKERKSRERKKNPIKQDIIQTIFDALQSKYSEISVTNDEKYVELAVDGAKFTINLVQHREKKEK